MKKTAALLLSICTTACWPQLAIVNDQVLAEATRERKARLLRGLNNVLVYPISLPESAKGCGLNADALNTSLNFILGQSPLGQKLSPSRPPDAFLEAIVDVMPVSGSPGCVFVLQLEVEVPAKTDRDGMAVTGNAYRSGYMGVGPRGTFQRQVVEAPETKLKELVVVFNDANRK